MNTLQHWQAPQLVDLSASETRSGQPAPNEGYGSIGSSIFVSIGPETTPGPGGS